MSYIVAAFYHFFEFPDFEAHQKDFRWLLKTRDIKGSLLIASEGINGTVSGKRENIDDFLTHLKKVTGEFSHKESLHDRQPFGEAKVRLKKELISLGEKAVPRVRTGKHVPASEWNALISDPTVTVIDARNSYETHLGGFEHATDPKTKNFKQLPDFVRKHLDPNEHTKIATYCTGGIRCEKFTSWLLDQGFKDVYQLDGGILHYLEVTPPEESLFKGECYVFDERVAVGEGLEASKTASQCNACGHALTPEDRAHPNYSEDKSCGFCA